jgi:hypothetical protein
MKLGGYIGNAFTRYVILPAALITFSIGASAQKLDGDTQSYRIPDINGDGVPEVVTTVNKIYDHTNRLYLLKSGHADDTYSELGVFDGRILKTRAVYGSNNKFRGMGVKTSEGNGRYYFIDITDDGKFSAPKRIKGKEFRKL